VTGVQTCALPIFAIVATRPGYYRKDDKMDENSGPANSNALVMRLDLG